MITIVLGVLFGFVAALAWIRFARAWKDIDHE